MQSIVVVMGVAGSGKSTVGKLAAAELKFEFAEGDEFHPESNVAKMSAGHPLTDEDRWPWLERIGDWIGMRAREDRGAVVTCSALKHSYRRVLGAASSSVWFAQLDAPRSVIQDRLGQRQGHFMPTQLLQSQYNDLEPLSEDEPGAKIDIVQAPEYAARDIVAAITKRDGRIA